MGKGINPNLKFKSRRLRTVEEYLDGFRRQDRYILSEALTLVESTNKVQRLLGESILNKIDPKDHTHTIRLGITGSPGAGKSTFIEALGQQLTEKGHKVAVLAIDPSSTKSQGSILGDKTRMSALSTNPDAFVRPTASSNILGGVARATKESISLCEAAGYDVILIESVGVGQSETMLSDLVDMYLLLLLPGGGDGVQGIKRGVVELADILVINKYDGDRKIIAEQSQKDFGAAVRLFHHELENWKVPVSLCSAIKKAGIDEVWARVSEYIKLSREADFFLKNRIHQDQKWIKNQIKSIITIKSEELFAAQSHLDIADSPNRQSIFKLLQETKEKIENQYQKLIAK